MQRLLIAAVLLAAAFYAYGEFTGPGSGFRVSSTRTGPPSGFTAARTKVIGGVSGAAQAIGN